VNNRTEAWRDTLPNQALECAMKRDLGMDEGLWQQSR
jgi:hypothetical protein